MPDVIFPMCLYKYVCEIEEFFFLFKTLSWFILEANTKTYESIV